MGCVCGVRGWGDFVGGHPAKRACRQPPPARAVLPSATNVLFNHQTLTIKHEFVIPQQVVVLGLPWTSEDATLERYFSQYGPVEEATVMRDRYTGKSRGFGFVTYAFAGALQQLDRLLNQPFNGLFV